MTQPHIKVGILSAPELHVTLLGCFTCAQTGTTAEGPQTFAALPGGKGMEWQGRVFDTLSFTPAEASPVFEVDGVTIGVNFHWERRETQRFTGSFSLIIEDGKLTLINILPVEDYLASVISSEMSATASEEFLKAHAVISRSWLLAQIDKTNRMESKAYPSETITDEEIVRWYDRDDHTNFDVCADDHCQRYQGITRRTSPVVEVAIEHTRGMVLTDENGHYCDARFSKCCGGVFEEFENCWEPVHHSYLVARHDSDNANDFPDLTIEENARRWILSNPPAYCNTTKASILSQVLNSYDLETPDFYRWTKTYTRAELSALVARRTGIDFGDIIALEPLARGTSGRISRLRIRGTRRTMIIGKELEIRRALSESHLYSSAFVTDYGTPDSDGIPSSITLTGAGWGHGVGLCQIGAAMMGAEGKSFREILSHYFPGANLETLY